MLHKTNLWQLLTKTCIHQSSIKSVSGYLAQVVLLRDGCFQPLCHSNIPKQGCCCVESIFTCISTLYVHILLLYRSSTTPSVTQPSPVQTPTSQAGPSSADRKDTSTLEKEKRFVGIFSATLNHSISFSRLTRE